MIGKDLKKEVKRAVFLRDGEDNWRVQLPGEHFLKVVRDRSSPDFKGREISPFDWDSKVSLVSIQIKMVLEGLEVVDGAPGKEGVKVVYKITGASRNGQMKGTIVIDEKKGITVSGVTSSQKVKLEELLRE